VRFVMAAANHLSNGPSTFPFTIFPGRWQDKTLQTFQARAISKGDTVVGNDVWFGRDVTVTPSIERYMDACRCPEAAVGGDMDAYRRSRPPADRHMDVAVMSRGGMGTWA
jgi:virginiamycin A acetyltransferase